MAKQAEQARFNRPFDLRQRLGLAICVEVSLSCKKWKGEHAGWVGSNGLAGWPLTCRVSKTGPGSGTIVGSASPVSAFVPPECLMTTRELILNIAVAAAIVLLCACDRAGNRSMARLRTAQVADLEIARATRMGVDLKGVHSCRRAWISSAACPTPAPRLTRRAS